MRDPLLKGASAGLILALPVLILVASGSATAPVGAALAVGPVEAILALGLWFANRSRRLLCREEGHDAASARAGLSPLKANSLLG